MLKFNSYPARFMLKLQRIKYGKNLKMIGWPIVYRFHGSDIYIGNNVVINSGVMANLLGLYQRTILVAKNGGIIKIGDNVGISGSTIYAWDRIEIGDYAKIGANVKIVDNDFHPTDP